ncbi:MAG: thioesterase family protein [Alphaproteobacteria bacterium]|nr:thioesterase family protein [Alphaproteobacteria bacterium]
MNLWLRLIWMLLTVWRRRQVSILGASSLSMRVMPNDLDFNGHVNNGRFLTLADVGRMDFVLRSGAAKAAFRMRALPIVGDSLAKFRRDLKLFERYELQTRLLGWDDKWTFMEHRFLRHGRVLGVVVIRGLFKGPQGPITPAAFLAAMDLRPEAPALPDWVLDWSRSCDALSRNLRAEEEIAVTSA